MIALALLIGFAALAICASTFRTQAKTQRYLIETQFHISRRWRALGRDNEAAKSDATLRKLRRHLPVLSVLGLEWLVKPKPLNLVSESAPTSGGTP